jgi:hypothetical protein
MRFAEIWVNMGHQLATSDAGLRGLPLLVATQASMLSTASDQQPSFAEDS